MKKPFIVLAASLSLLSCDYIIKKQDKNPAEAKTDTFMVLGTDKDKNGCVASAGYRWSTLQNNCVRLVEDAYRLNAAEKAEDESPVKSAFVIFDEDKNKAELFLPDKATSVIMEKDGKNVFRNGQWSLHSDKGYTLKESGRLIYVGAEPVQEGQVTGDEQEES